MIEPFDAVRIKIKELLGVCFIVYVTNCFLYLERILFITDEDKAIK